MNKWKQNKRKWISRIAIGYFSCCDAFTKGRIRPPGSCLPGGACACCGHEFPCSGRERRSGHVDSGPSRSGGGNDSGSRGSGHPRARSDGRGRSVQRSSGSSRPNDCRGAGYGRGGRRTAPRAGCRSARPGRCCGRSDAGCASPAPDVAQTAPTNMNVSVRVDSPGDNGSVEQANAAVQPARPRLPRPPLSISRIRRSIRSRYRPPRRRRPIRRRRRPRQSLRRPATVGRGTGSGIAAMRYRISRSRRRSGHRTGPGTGIGIAEIRNPMPENTSGEKPPQYQPGVTQYRPININISIRINSPGNDGPVSQTNVAVVLAAPALPKLRIEVPSAPLPTQAGSAPVSSEAAAPLTFMAEVVGRRSSPIRPNRRRGRTNAAPPASPGAPQRRLRSRKACSCRRLRRGIGVISPPRSASAPRLRSRSGSRRPPRLRRASPGPRRSRRSSGRRRGIPPLRLARRRLRSAPPASHP